MLIGFVNGKPHFFLNTTDMTLHSPVPGGTHKWSTTGITTVAGLQMFAESKQYYTWGAVSYDPVVWRQEEEDRHE